MASRFCFPSLFDKSFWKISNFPGSTNGNPKFFGWFPTQLGVSENNGFSPQIIPCLIGFSMIFTIHFWGENPPIFGSTPQCSLEKTKKTPGCEVAEACRREDEATHENHEATSGKLTVTGKGEKNPTHWCKCRF